MLSRSKTSVITFQWGPPQLEAAFSNGPSKPGSLKADQMSVVLFPLVSPRPQLDDHKDGNSNPYIEAEYMCVCVYVWRVLIT